MKAKTVLEKTFSRDKSLAYFFMWDKSERMGYEKFVDYELKNSLFIYDPEKKKVSVWYDKNELGKIEEILTKKVKEDKKVLSDMEKDLKDEWTKLKPYLEDKKQIISFGELNSFYSGITKWWAAMSTAYLIIENKRIPSLLREKFLKFREKSENYTNEMDYLLVNFFIEKYGKNLAKFVLVDEIKKGFKKEEIKKRVGGWIIFNQKMFPFKDLGKILKENKIILKKEKINGKKEIKGAIAFPGRVIGKVRKILLRDDIGKFKEEEILVAETTFPDHLLAMKKAAAFVTDEGGVTCHAAIVSRELKKPCIIGTKIATQVLKDGDEVEVDAEKGVVRILK